MDQYLRLSQTLQSRDPMPAIQELLRHAGMTVQDLVGYVSGQQPEQASAGAAREIMELRNQVGQLQQQLQGELGQVKSTLQNQQAQGLLGEIQQFASDKPRFDELSMEIAAQVRAGYDLDEAYVRAERLNPLAAAPPPPAAAQTGAPAAAQTGAHDPMAQTRGSLSVTGAPAAGSDPRNRGPSPTTRAALDKSWALLGLPQ
jgi:TolA-binding protein